MVAMRASVVARNTKMVVRWAFVVAMLRMDTRKRCIHVGRFDFLVDMERWQLIGGFAI